LLYLQINRYASQAHDLNKYSYPDTQLLFTLHTSVYLKVSEKF